MKILSWNVLFSNARQDEAFAFIDQTDADIVCLQEVPENFLARLKTLPYRVVSAPETDRVFGGKRSTQFVVILSKFPLLAEGAFPIPPSEPEAPLRTRLFARLMYLLRLFAKGCGNRHGIFADLETAYGRAIRVVCIHLSLTHPARRERELQLAFRAMHDELPTVIAGDFNTIGHRRMSVLNWLLGGTLGDALFPARERLRREERFRAHGLLNPLRGLSTHPASASQLDHILVPDTATILSAKRIRERHGSDHNPVLIEVR